MNFWISSSKISDVNSVWTRITPSLSFSPYLSLKFSIPEYSSSWCAKSGIIFKMAFFKDPRLLSIFFNVSCWFIFANPRSISRRVTKGSECHGVTYIPKSCSAEYLAIHFKISTFLLRVLHSIRAPSNSRQIGFISVVIFIYRRILPSISFSSRAIM